jgi:hypothetical protein
MRHQSLPLRTQAFAVAVTAFAFVALALAPFACSVIVAKPAIAKPVIGFQTGTAPAAWLLPNRDEKKTKPTPTDSFDTLVLCPSPFQTALQPWLDYRRQQGHRIHVVKPQSSAFGVKRQIATFAAANAKLQHLVLIGDAFDKKTDARFFVPTEYVLAKATVKFGAEPEIATDNPYADLDGDGVPDLSIGRIPVDSSQELTQFTQRVINYESQPAAQWQSRMNFVAGVGGFGRIVDNVIEEVAKKIITELVPGEIKTSMTYGSWTSPYCPNPEAFSQTAIERFNEGCLFWVYIGHGDRTRLDRVHLPDQSHLVLDKQSVEKINCRSGNPIAVFLACYTNSYDSDEDCLGELMLKRPNGPVAIIGGSRVTMPAGMGLLSLALIDEYFHPPDVDSQSPITLGQVFLNAKRELSSGKRAFKGYRNLIESVATSLLPDQPFENERQDHVQLMQLLGDPLLRLKKTTPIDLQAEQAGERVTVWGQVERPHPKTNAEPTRGAATKIRLQLCYQRDRLKDRFRRRRKYASTNREFSKFQTVYDQARNLVCLQKTVTTDDDGKFRTNFVLPEHVDGECVIIATTIDQNHYHTGSTKIDIDKR